MIEKDLIIGHLLVFIQLLLYTVRLRTNLDNTIQRWNKFKANMFNLILSDAITFL